MCFFLGPIYTTGQGGLVKYMPKSTWVFWSGAREGTSLVRGMVSVLTNEIPFGETQLEAPHAPNVLQTLLWT